MIRKRFMISENNEKLLHEIRLADPAIINDSDALGYVFSEYVRLKDLRDTERDFKISLAIQKETEKKMSRLMDAVNTILFKSNIDECIPAAYMESPVFIKSREYEKVLLVKLKQKKDNRNKKRKEPQLLTKVQK